MYTNAIAAKRQTKQEAVLNLLRNKGNAGALNLDLNPITFRYGASIHNLRQRGYTIKTEAVDTQAGIWRFTLQSEPATA